MKIGSLARRVASAVLLCALAGPALADGDAAAAGPRPPPQQRRPPPTVLVLPLGFGVLLPLTLPTATPRARIAQVGEARDAPAPARADDRAGQAPTEAR